MRKENLLFKRLLTLMATVALLLGLSFGVAGQRTVTVGLQSPDPVQIGTSATFPIIVFNGSGSATGNKSLVFSGTGLTGSFAPDKLNVNGGGTGNSVLTIPTTGLSAGSYPFTVTHDGISGGGTLVVVDACTPPSITDQPASLSDVCLGSEQSFTVTATGTNLTYKWYLDGEEISGATSATYTIASVVAADAGNYYVIVSGDCGDPQPSNTVSLAIDNDLPQLTGTAYTGDVDINTCLPDEEDAEEDFDEEKALLGYTDNCSGVLTATLTDTGVTGDNCSWTVTYTYTVTDVAGNALTNQTYTRKGGDKTLPALTGTAYTGDVDINACKPNLTAAEAAFNSTNALLGYTDNCSGALTATLTGTAVIGSDCDWTVTYTYTVKDACLNELTNQTYTRKGGDKTNPTVVTKNIEVTLGMDGTASITDDAVNNGSSDNCSGSLTFSTDIKDFDCDNLGANTVTLTVTDGCENSASNTATVAVKLRPTTMTYTGGLTIQYSDEVTLSAVLKDQLTGSPLEGMEIIFTIGSQSVSAETDENGLAETTLIVTQPAGMYTVKAAFAGECPYAASSRTLPFIITKEMACVNYTGPMYVSTSSTSTSVAKFTLSASISEWDWELGPGDPVPGDLTNAKVRFQYLNGSTWTTIATKDVVLVEGTDAGIAVHEWEWNLGNSDADQIYVRMVVVGDYFTNYGMCNDMAVITITKPVGTEFISGGGYLVLEKPAGSVNATPGLNNNFGFNVKWNKSGKNLQGNINTIIRVLEEVDGEPYIRKYQVKGNRLSSLVVNDNKAVFLGKSAIQDVTEDIAVPVGGNYELQVTMTDNGEPGSEDMINISVLNKDGGLFFTSRWEDGTGWMGNPVAGPAEQVLAGGNLKVHGLSMLKSAEMVSINVLDEPVLTAGDALRVYPNPFKDRLFFEFTPETGADARLELFDMRGARVATLMSNRVEAGQLYRIDYVPSNIPSGMLMYRLTIGNDVSQGKILYQQER